MTSYKKNI